MSLKITYEAYGRTGNNLIQFATCKLIQIMFGQHSFIYNKKLLNPIIFDDKLYQKLIEGDRDTEELVKNRNILCQGYFQDDRLLLCFREQLVEEFLKSRETIYDNNCRNRCLRSFFQVGPQISPSEKDIIISLRLEDFFQASTSSTNIIPPQFYLDIISHQKYERLIIVCKRPSSDPSAQWEKKYLSKFMHLNPIISHGSLEQDSALMRAAPRLIHSNSTLCWFNSYLSNKLQRFIPDTGFYPEQRLGLIDISTDVIIKVKPMTNNEVLNL